MQELAGALIIKEKKLLLIYRSDEEHWEIPGGKVEENESPTEAAIRETKEEISIDAELEKPFYSGEFEKDGQLYLWHGYLAKTEQEPEKAEEQIEEIQYIGLEELEETDLAPNLKQIQPALRKILS